MKILRVRRGFTTNSSASSEWIPPPDANPGTPIPNTSAPMPIGVTKVVLPVNLQGPNYNWSDIAKGGGLVAIVALAFVAERIARVIRRRGKQDEVDHDDAL